MKFSIRDLLWFTVVVALCLALIYVKWPTGIGRYQFEVDPGFHWNYYIDTSTGRVWRQMSTEKLATGKSGRRPQTNDCPTLQHPPQFQAHDRNSRSRTPDLAAKKILENLAGGA